MGSSLLIDDCTEMRPDNSFPKSRWRVIRHQPLPGALNMAIDEAILEAVGRSEVPPTLRFYAWEPACLSLGYAQPSSDINFDILSSSGWDHVRRPTGGRAILHTDELTYSVIGPEDDPRLSGGVLRSYKNLAQALLQGLHRLEIPAEALETPVAQPSINKEGSPKQNLNPVCFEIPSNYEITVAGRKLVGSAQARRKAGVLQHGSMPLWGDLTRIIRVLKFPDLAVQKHAAERLLERAATVEMVIGKRVDWGDAADALTHAFSETLNLDLVAGELTEIERERADALVLSKFSAREWNYRV